jgi:arylsulfatase A-like enzyme/tetratricopeptide (TPR) repeat protein
LARDFAGSNLSLQLFGRTMKAIYGIVIAAMVAVATWWFWPMPAFTLQRTADRNVLVISIDTLRADALGSYGGRAATPRLDGLAASGARFTFAHAHAVVTLPSHTSLFTGLYPYQHGVRDNTGYRVRAGEATLATRLKALGFATGAFVGAFPLDQRFGLNQGFDVYDDRLPESGPTVDFALPERRADQVVGAATAWIGQQQTPWFSWVHVFDPHAPYRPPAPFDTQYAADPYAGEVAWTDAALAPLFDQLRTLSRPTLVIVTSDHGESLGEHGELTHGIFAYDATLRVPLIVAEVTPDGAEASGSRGRTIDTPARHVDVVPTVLDAVGAAADATLAGTSLLDVITTGRGETRPSYFEAMTANLSRGWAPLRGVLVDRDKYIDLPIPERYDLHADPTEQRNLASADADRTQVLFNTLRTFDTAPPGQPGEESGAVLERLRALGYIGGSPAPVRERYTEADDPKQLIDLDKMLHDAGDLYSRGRRDEAVAAFRAVITRRPDTADAYRYLAFVFWQTGRPADAIATLEAALARGLTQRDIRVKLGIYLAESGAADRAIPLLEAMPVDDNEVLNALGIAYGQNGRLAEAMRTFERALQVDSTSALSHQNIATLQLQTGDFAASEASFRRALSIDATLAGAYTGLGVTLTRLNRLPEALDAWRRAVSLDPRDFNALFNLTMELFESGQAGEARRHGEQFVATAPPAFFAADIARVRARLAGGRF